MVKTMALVNILEFLLWSMGLMVNGQKVTTAIDTHNAKIFPVVMIKNER